MPQEIPIDMSLPEKIAATEVTTQIYGLVNLACQLTPDQVALAVKLQEEILKTEIGGPARDIPEMNARVVRAFATWHKRMMELMPVAREIASRPPITDEDIRFIDLGEGTD
jgi:hypothetical protein